MSHVLDSHTSRRPRSQRSIYQVHYALQQQEMTARPMPLPSDPVEVQAYSLQVAGHMKTEDRKFLGVLQCSNGTILKPIIKESQKREVEFYTRIMEASNRDLVELREFAPKYYGCQKFTYNGHEQDYLVLEDLAERMLEPCIMDVKIGKRTWDPLATEEKIRKEQSKYSLCKQEFGFCIPGYQVYKLASGKLHKYNKEHGKKLHGHMVRAAIRSFLNGVGTSLCRALVLQFLSSLWRLQRWAARQTAVRLYASSLLLVYDAARLRECCAETEMQTSSARCRATSTRRRSIPALHADASFSGQLSAKGPIYKKVSSVATSPMSGGNLSPPPVTSPWSEALEKLNHNHSFDHNYEDKLCKIKMNYRALLDQLSTDSATPPAWGSVKLIDFAHAFFNDDDDMTTDDNFREGIDSFVDIFEAFLSETEDQVF